MLRDLSLTLRQEEEMALPLTKQEECVKVNDVLDLSKLSSLHILLVTISGQWYTYREWYVKIPG